MTMRLCWIISWKHINRIRNLEKWKRKLEQIKVKYVTMKVEAKWSSAKKYKQLLKIGKTAGEKEMKTLVVLQSHRTKIGQ